MQKLLLTQWMVV